MSLSEDRFPLFRDMRLDVGRRPAHPGLQDGITDTEQLGDAGGEIHSSLVPVAVTTGPHLACSDLMNAAYSPGDIGDGTASWPSSCFCTSAERSVAAAALCSLSSTSAGTPAGVTKPYQLSEITLLKPASPVVGTSGSAGLRVADVTASALTRPERVCGSRPGA